MNKEALLGISKIVRRVKTKFYSIEEPDKLLEFINDNIKPTDENKKQRGEVFTPMKVVNEMLDKLPIDVWTNLNFKWLDPAAGMGNFPIAIYLRLIKSLKTKIPNEEKLRKHILENMLFMVEIDKYNVFMLKKILCGHKYKLNVIEGDSLKSIGNSAFYDIIIGNPPFNKPSSDSPYYNEFIRYFENKCNLLMFVVPSRWFAGGKGLDTFRKFMLNKKDIEFIYHFDDAKKLFGNTIQLKGGINYFLINKKYNGKCKIVTNNLNIANINLNKYDILIPNIKYYKLIDKLNKYISISSIFISQDHYKIQSNDSRLIDKNGFDKKNIKDYLKCYVSKKQKGEYKYINKKEIKKDVKKYKVITVSASGKGSDGFGNIFTGLPDEVHTKSYISFNLNSKNDAESLLDYLKCKLPNFMLSLRKITHNISGETCKWIPLPPLNKIWDNESVYKFYKLTQEEIKIVEDGIKNI